MLTEVRLPELGMNAGQPVTLSVWFADEGDEVYEGDRLVEILVNGATFDVSAPATGTLTKLIAYPDDALQPGQLLGLIENKSVVTGD
jgi:pyruvate/2-oxoglutarate dehydrogenase complex dihydrolipoamide acyltransferase (E2) component